jgi:probable F420-dependent oxidoreductase
MEYSLIYPVKEGYLRPELITSVATAAEEAGFHSFLMWDHYLLPSGPDTLDAWAALAYVAGITSTIKLGTVVTPIPFRPPAQLAKVVATVDILSGGRTILGVGAGWHKPEFDGFSQWDGDGVRVDRTIEALDLMTRLWTGEPVDFKGRFYSAEGAQIVPRPVQRPHPPLWFGVKGRRMMELTARHGDVWIPTKIEPDEYRRGMERLRTLRNGMGIQGEVKGALQQFDLFTDPDDFLRSINEYAGAGCGYYGAIWSYPPDEMVPRIGWFAREVKPHGPD